MSEPLRDLPPVPHCWIGSPAILPASQPSFSIWAIPSTPHPPVPAAPSKPCFSAELVKSSHKCPSSGHGFSRAVSASKRVRLHRLRKNDSVVILSAGFARRISLIAQVSRKERFFASLRMTIKETFSAPCSAAEGLILEFSHMRGAPERLPIEFSGKPTARKRIFPGNAILPNGAFRFGVHRGPAPQFQNGNFHFTLEIAVVL